MRPLVIVELEIGAQTVPGFAGRGVFGELDLLVPRPDPPGQASQCARDVR